MAYQRSMEVLAVKCACRLQNFCPGKIRTRSQKICICLFKFQGEKFLDPVVKADQWTKYVDDIGIAAINATELTRNIPAVFKCIHRAELNLTVEKRQSGVRQVECLGRTISPEGISPQARKIHIFLEKLRCPKSRKTPQRNRDYKNYYSIYIPRMAGQLSLFYKLFKIEVPINNTSQLKESFDARKRSVMWSLWVSTETTHSRKAACANDGSKLQKHWICPHDWRQSRSKHTIEAENLSPFGVWIGNFLPCLTRVVCILKKTFGN